MKIAKEILTWIGSISIGFVAALIITIFLFQPTKVVGDSMFPTLHTGERILISKVFHTFTMLSSPKEDDIPYDAIVIIDSRVDQKRTIKDDLLQNPIIKFILNEPDENIIWVKRVIGKPGDRIKIQDGRLYRNGKLINEKYIHEKMDTMDMEITVPANCIFVMGDNRNNSRDSREIGPVPLDHVLGVKLFS